MAQGDVTSRDALRARLIDVAAELLASGGAGAVTTRAVAAAAGVQAPTLYRLFGDKDGLLDAVAESGFETWVAVKSRRRTHPDPVRDLRTGFESAVDFGLANPGLAVLMADPQRSASSPAVTSGRAALAAKVHRVARAGRLAVPEPRAVELLHATGMGVTLTLLAQPPGGRDGGLVGAAFEAVAAQILLGTPSGASPGPVAAAVSLRAGLAELEVLSPAERRLLGEWLDRIAAD